MWEEWKYHFLEDNYGLLTNKQIAEHIGLSSYTVRRTASDLKIKSKWQKEYAVYFGDEYQFSGNIKKCSKRLGVKIQTFRGYISKSGRYEDGIHIVELGKWRKDEDVLEVV